MCSAAELTELKEKGDDCDAAPAGPSLSFRRGTEGEVAGHKPSPILRDVYKRAANLTE
jgi:hypothetical protein